MIKSGNRSIVVLIALGLLLSGFFLSAQSNKKELESRKNQLQKEIDQANKLLNQTKKNKRLSLSQLVALNNKIAKREEMIATINAELKELSNQIEGNEREINKLEGELTQLKKEYAQMVYVAWKNRNAYDKIMFLFSSRDFNQAYKRIRYFQQYADYRKMQAAMIDSTKAHILDNNKKLGERKMAQNNLLDSKENEKQKLTKEKSQKEEALVGLQKREKQLKADLKKKQSDANKLNAAIKRIIEEEVRKAREEAAKAAAAKPKPKPKPSDPKVKTTVEPSKPEKEPMKLMLTPEAEKLSNSFEANKNKLPWPVAEGVISGWFGEHDHPVLKGIKVKNNGIDITTRPGASSRAIFDGEVSGVVSIPGAGKAVIIRHGEYLTVYSNLQETNVKRGDKVKTKQVIGSVMADEDGKGEIHFEIWKGSVLLNPTAWIIK